MNTSSRRTYFNRIAIGLGFLLAIIVYNAVPGWTVPTLGQSLWVSTFAQSIANQHLLALTSNNTGAPFPSPMAFGLPGAYVMAILLRTGMQTATAYGFMCVIWLAVAYVGAIRLAIRLGVSPTRAALLSTTWLCLPMVWSHANYSLLSIGFALLPAYLVPVFDACRGSQLPGTWKSRLGLGVRLTVVGTISAFMDGYTFVMYAFASLAWLAADALVNWRERRMAAWGGILIQGCALVIAASLYRFYVGTSGYYASPLSTFRGWGVDVSFLLRPTEGMSLIGDILHIGEYRGEGEWFGDRSVWDSTFILPLLLAAAVAWRAAHTQPVVRWAAVAMIVAGVYMALGPSLKAWSPRTDANFVVDGDPHFMPSSAARMPTGSGWISSHVPVLRNMRAPYRWLALGMLGMWILLVLAQRRGQGSRAACVATWIVLLVGLPPPVARITEGRLYHSMWHRVEHDVLKPFRKNVPPGSLVAGIPYANDFLLGYLAAKSGARTYNTGGDKNIELALPHWPQRMRTLAFGELPSDVMATAENLFMSGEATVLMIPLYQEPSASHAWPCVPLRITEMSDEDASPSLRCHSTLAGKIEAILAPFAEAPGFRVVRTPSFALVFPDADLRDPRARDDWSLSRRKGVPSYPFKPSDLSDEMASQIFIDGWSPIESGHVWSAARALLRLPLPPFCGPQGCTITLTFHTFAASMIHTKKVSVKIDGVPVVEKVTGDDFRTIEITTPATRRLATVSIEVRGATSPKVQGISEDNRVLGIALYQVEVSPIGALP